MSSSNPKPTLLVFTLGPCAENLRKRLLPHGLSAAEHQLHQAGLDRAIDAGRQAGCDVVVAASASTALPTGVRRLAQKGNGLGARIRSALGTLQRERPGGVVVIVGTDVPGLTTQHIRAALTRLDAAPDEVVLGPCPDGGFYLLATRKPLDPLLARVKWCRRDTLASFLALLRSNGRSAHLLSPLRDLDRAADVDAWLAFEAGGPARVLARWLLRLRAELLDLPVVLCLGQPLPAYAPVLSARGPPL
ncbi:MAG: DUF2064 domain-containing protein [Acidobacteriota bacterium]